MALVSSTDRRTLACRVRCAVRLVVTVTFAAWLSLIGGCATGPRAGEGPDWLNNPQGMVDERAVFAGREAFASGEAEHVGIVTASPARLTLADDQSTRYPRRGTWTSPVREPRVPFTELLPSWNLTAPDQTGATLFIRTRDRATGAWSPWLYLGSWGRTPRRGKDSIAFEHGEVDIDYIKLTRPADAYQARVNLYSYAIESDRAPALEKLVVVSSGPGVVTTGEPAPPADRWARDLGVPFRTQAVEGDRLKPRICSPTSVSMVMEHFGVSLPTRTNALAIYDEEYGIFGNWGRAVAWASEQGFDAELVRVRTWDQVKRYIAEGQPIIASIRFGRDEFPSNVMRSTAGHLIVIRGLTPEGDAIVNDPASKDHGEGIVYEADELARAWLDKGGVAYIIRPRAIP